MSRQKKTHPAEFNLADYVYRRIRDLTERERIELSRILVDRLPKFIDYCIADAMMHTMIPASDKNNGKDAGDNQLANNS